MHTAFVRTRSKRQKIISVEHLLLELADSKHLADLWKNFRVNVKSLSKDLSNYLDENTPIDDSDQDKVDTEPTLGFQRVIQRAILHVQSASRGGSVEPINLLIAIFGEMDTFATDILAQYQITRLDVVNYYLHDTPPSFAIKSEQSGNESKKFILSEVAKMESVELERTTVSKSPPKLFISYSHADIACLERLLVHLRPLQKSKSIVCWSDKNIRTGEKWRQEIRQNLEDAAIAILLVSADFLASDFIVNHELSPLLVKAEARGLRILPVILKPCGFLRDSVLSSFQAINDPSLPLLGLDHIEQEAIYNRIADEVSEEIRLKPTT